MSEQQSHGPSGSILRTICPAKINLHLRVGERDRYGYHPLETRFQAISLCDELELEVGRSGLEVEGMELPPENTVSKALRLISEGIVFPQFGIRLRKRIPAQAGMGGGSSNAAGLLRLMRKLAHPLSGTSAFADTAAAVGADVPFFLVGGQADATGRGEVLTPRDDETLRHLTVVMPNDACPTPAMYAALDRLRESGRPTPPLDGLIENDFHAVMPEGSASALRRMLSLGLGPCGLCGSGAAVFGFASDETEAERCAADFRSSGLQAWACRTLTRSESTAVWSTDSAS